MSKFWKKISWYVALIAFIRPDRLTGPVELPADDAYIPDEAVQWWYWTGHLYTKEGRRFGFEVVFFSFDNFTLFRDQLVQAAITDVEENSFSFDEFIPLYHPRRIKDSFDLHSGYLNGKKITATGGNGTDKLHCEVGKYKLDIELKSTKPVTMHYDGKEHHYCFGGYTYYYSRTHMETTGTLSIDGKLHQVNGISWFDRQYGELEPAMFKGWQWFCIELEDNRQYMLFDFLGNDAVKEKYGSFIDTAGQVRTLQADEFHIEVLGHWKSPHSDANYPSGWKVAVDGMNLVVQPLVKDQELHSKQGELWVGVYWEGACSVSGDAKGQAYVELNGYAPPVQAG